MILRVAAAAAVVAGLESLAGVFDLSDTPVVVRTAYLVAVNWMGGALAVLAYQAALGIVWAQDRLWARAAIAAALTSVPGGALLWGTTWLFGVGLPPQALPLFMLYGLPFNIAFIAVIVAPAMDAAIRGVPTGNAGGRPSAGFMDRLPPNLRGGELWALKGEDHYLRVFTSRGETLIRLRMADALRELKEVEGAQPHRSWWVARAAVRDVKRADGRIALVLPDGQEAAVARGSVRDLKDAGWI